MTQIMIDVDTHRHKLLLPRAGGREKVILRLQTLIKKKQILLRSGNPDHSYEVVRMVRLAVARITGILFHDVWFTL